MELLKSIAYDWGYPRRPKTRRFVGYFAYTGVRSSECVRQMRMRRPYRSVFPNYWLMVKRQYVLMSRLAQKHRVGDSNSLSDLNGYSARRKQRSSCPTVRGRQVRETAARISSRPIKFG